MNALRPLFLVLVGALLSADLSAQLVSTKASIAFGTVGVYTSKLDTFYVKNTSGSAITVTSVVNTRSSYSVQNPDGSLTPTIAAGDSVRYVVTFRPDTVGAVGDSVVVSHAGGSVRVDVTGTGKNNIALLNNAGAGITTFTFANTLAGVAKTDSIRVHNSGFYAVNVTGLTSGNPDFSFAPSTPFAIAAGETAKVYITYTGSAIGFDTGTLAVAHDDSAKGSSPVNLTLNARAIGNLQFTRGGVYIDPATDWMAVNASNDGARNGTTAPGVGVDSSRLVLVTLINRGTGSINIDSIRFSTPNFTSLVPTPYEHRAGSAYDRILRFNYNPRSLSSPDHFDTLLVFSSDSIPGANPMRLAVRGASTARVHVLTTGNGTSINYGTVALNTTVSAPVRTLNYTGAGATVDSVRLKTGDPRFAVGTVNTASFVSGTDRVVEVLFTATGPDGTYRDTVLVYVNGSATPRSLPLSGVVATSIVFNPPATTINMGDLPVQGQRDTTIKIYNRTPDNYTINSLAMSSGSQYQIQTNTASQAFNAGDSITIVVRFVPTTGGLHRDTLLVSHNMPTFPPINLPNPHRIAFLGTGNTNAVIDPVDYVTVDNASGIEGFAIQSPDSSYVEVGAFWQNTSGFGGTHRRAPNLSGSGAGSAATYTFKLDSTGPYLTYHYMVNSPNASADAIVHFRKFGFGGIIDSLRYTQLNNNATGFGATWYPLAMHHYLGVGSGAAQVTIGADAITGGFLRLDAVRMLRSRLTADIEFGRRDAAFGPVRVPQESPDVTVGDEFIHQFRLWNLGRDTLRVTNIQFFPTVTPVPWYYTKNWSAGQTIVIPPMSVNGSVESGGFFDLQVSFFPFQEGSARDSMVITSNDPLEPKASMVFLGNGVNFNFIMNASEGGTEPHFRAPGPPAVPTIPRYFELPNGSWLSSVQSPIFPVSGQNLRSRVNIGGVETLPHAAYFEFEMPDVVFGVNTFGDFILEHSGPVGSPNGHSRAKLIVTHTFGIPADSGEYSALLQPSGWYQVGGPLKTFKMAPGGPITIEIKRDGTTDVGGASNLLRVDLLRVRKVPTGALIRVDVATGATVSFGDVNFRDPAGPGGQLNKRTVTLGSRGESQLEVRNIRFRSGARFQITNPPASYPLYLRALSGQYPLTIEFNPDRIQPLYRDTLEILSNSTQDSLILIPVVGNGIGGVFVVNDDGGAPERASHPAFGGLYLGRWDQANMSRWQVETAPVADSIGLGQTIRRLPMRFNRTGFFEWYPLLPTEPGAGDSMYVRVIATVRPGLSTGAPAARYIVYGPAGTIGKDTVVNQNGRAAGPRRVGEIDLGSHWFVRGGRDAYRDTLVGAGPGVFGHVRVQVDTAAANFAGTDTLSLVADAIVLLELEAPGSVTGVETESDVPKEFALAQNYPNPFNPTTTIRFSLPAKLGVELKVFDLLGREVRTLLPGDNIDAGTHTVVWDGRGNNGQAVSTGVYFYRIVAGGYVQSKKMLLLK